MFYSSIFGHCIELFGTETMCGRQHIIRADDWARAVEGTVITADTNQIGELLHVVHVQTIEDGECVANEGEE